MAIGRFRTISIGLSMVFLSMTLQSCGVIEVVVRAVGRICEQPEFVVTKTADTNDGLCSADDCSLREAVITANACPGPQTIRLPAGHYPLTRTGADEDQARTGDLDIRDDLTILGEGAPSISGENQDRIFDIFDITTPATVEMDLLILVNGRAQFGGAIRNFGNLTIRSSSIHDNVAAVPPGAVDTSPANGGGILNIQNTLTLLNTQIFDNLADEGGGVVNFAGGTLIATDVLLQGNEATDFGGGLWNGQTINASATLNNVQVRMNRAGAGGGGIMNAGQLEANGITFDENITTGNGGGLYVGAEAETAIFDAWFTNNNADRGGAVYNEGLLHLYRTGVNGNTAFGGQGGGLANVRNPLLPASDDGAMLLLRNVTVSGNMLGTPSTPGGAGLYNEGGSLRIEFNTFAYNSPDGVFSTGGPEIGIRSSIFASQYPNCSGVTGASGGYNVEWANTCSFTGVGDQPNTNPQLMWLSHYGGISLSHALSLTSPAVDAGDPDRCVATDQRGMARPQGARCDAGAFELEPGGVEPPPMPGDTEPAPTEPTPTPTPAAALAGPTDTPTPAAAPAGPTDTPTPAAAPAGPMTMNFNADSYSIIAGTCTKLRWDVKNAGEVRLDGEVVGALAARQVCPTSTKTYRLVGTAGAEQLAGLVTIEVSAPQEPPAAPEKLVISNRVCTDQAYTVTLSWIDQADNEDGFRVYQNGNLVATLGPNATTYTDNPPGSGPYTYGVEAFNSAGKSARPTVQEAGCIP